MDQPVLKFRPSFWVVWRFSASLWGLGILALIPSPGFPARAYVAPNGRIYEGSYDNPAGDSVPSRVLEYTGHGALLRSWPDCTPAERWRLAAR